MTINDALRQADNDHVVFFLLTAYAESLCWYRSARSCVPERVLRLPVAGVKDVIERVNALRNARYVHAQRPSMRRVLLDDALDVFDTASRRLNFLARRGKPRLLASELPEPAR